MINKYQVGGYVQPTEVYNAIGNGTASYSVLDFIGKAMNKIIPKPVAKAMTYISPLNYLAALKRGSINPKVGEEEISTWHPNIQLVGRVGEIAAGPKVIKGVKATPKVAVYTAAKAGVKPAKAAVIAREINQATKNKPKYTRVPSKNLFRTQVYKGGEITDPHSNFVTTDPQYAANYGKVIPYIFESKSIAKAREPMMGYRDPVSQDMFIYNNIKGNPNVTAIIGHDAITGEFTPSKGVEILNMDPKNLYPVKTLETAENAFTKNSSIIRTMQNNGKIRLSLSSHTKDKPRQFVLEPQGNNKFYVHMRTWDGDHVPANLTNGEKQQLFDALYNELPDNAEILFPKSGPRNYATRGTVAGLQRLARDPRFTPGTKGTLQYFDKDGRTIKTYEGTSFIKVPTTTSKIRTKKQGGKMNIIEFLKNGSGIHIKKQNQGKFTDYCGGKVTSACIAKGKKSPNPVIRKRATFAANVRKWKHEDGGLIAKALFGMSFNNLIKGVGNFVKNNKEGILDVAKQGISTIANNKLLSKQQKSVEQAVELNSKQQYLDNYNNALAQQTDRSPIVNSFNANMIAQAATPGINAMAEYQKAQIKSNFGQQKRANTQNFISSFSNLFSTKKA